MRVLVVFPRSPHPPLPCITSHANIILNIDCRRAYNHASPSASRTSVSLSSIAMISQTNITISRAPPTSDTHSGPEGPKTFRSPILNQYQDLLQELLLSVHPHPHAYNLWQIARKLPTTPSQERHRVILKKLARNGHPYITLDREIVDGFNFDDPRKRLKDQMFAGFAVDNVRTFYVAF